MDLINVVVGIVLLVMGFLSFLVAAGIAVRQYILPNRVVTDQSGLVESVVNLLIAILRAPPALAFLVVSLIFMGGGGYVLHVHPF